ncbi:MAG: hypothetical protein IJW51_01595 [Clostridia bacterium]|nr:hypothetical protein [Clostridia bacterium]
MRRTLLCALTALCLLLLLSCTGHKNENYITFEENGVLTARVAADEGGSLVVPAPAGTKAASCIGWQAKNASGTVFLPVGATYSYQAGEALVFTPLYLTFTTHEEVTLTEVENESGMQFTTSIAASEWTALFGAATALTRGTLILPVADLATLEGGLTHASLADENKQAIDIVTRSWLLESDTTLVFSATVKNSLLTDLTQKYTAVGYVKISYTNGTEAYVYAGYQANKAPAASPLSFTKLNLVTATEATLNLSSTSPGLAFITTVQKSDWAPISGARNVSCGTLIATAADLAEIGGTLTHAALRNAGKTPIDIPSHTWYAESETAYRFCATLVDIPTSSYLTAYTAIGYIKISHPDNTETYIYAHYGDGGAPNATLIVLANEAKNDLSDTQTSAYPYAVGEKFSPYTDAERNLISSFSSFTVILQYDKTVEGKKKLDQTHYGILNEHIVKFRDDEWNDEVGAIWNALGDIHYWGGCALVVGTESGLPLTADMIKAIKYYNGSIEVLVTTYIFHDGKIIFPHSNFTQNL